MYRPGQALRVPGERGSHISRQSTHVGGKFVSPMHRPLYSQEIFVILISVRARGGVVFKALYYIPAGRGFDSRWCHWNFSKT